MRLSVLLHTNKDWRDWLSVHKNSMTEEEKEWLKEWEQYDKKTSPKADENRSLIRYGHYIGWMTSRKVRI